MLRLLAVMLGQNLDVHNLNIGFASLSSPPLLTATPPIASIKVIWTCRGRNDLESPHAMSQCPT